MVERRAALALLEVDDLNVSFRTADGIVQAVRGVSYHIDAGQTLGIVGESGSGKSVSTQTVTGLTKGARISGSARFEGMDLLTAAPSQMQAIRGAKIGMIFQDPLSSLHPYYRVGWQIVEMIRLHDREIASTTPASGPSNCCALSAYRSRRRGSTTSRTSSPAACGSGR